MITHAILTLTLTLAPAVAGQKRLHEGVKGKWEASCDLVAVRGGSALARLAERDYQARETALYSKFVAQTKADQKEYKGDIGAGPWSYEAGGSVKLNRSGVVSILCGSYSYMGGAHGMGMSRTYNYGIVNGKPKKLTIWDIIRKENRSELRLILLGKAVKKEGTDWIQDGMVNDFTEDQLNRFWISRWGLTFEFDAYELGSYASGPFTFDVPWSELRQSMVAKNPLSGLLPKR